MTLIPALTMNELRAGDILLSRGEGWLSDLIVELDGGTYSHAALWSGKKVIEATLDGVVERGLKGPCTVFRFRKQSDGAEDTWLGSQGLPAEPVIKQARTFVGSNYAYDELVLLGALLVLRSKPKEPLMLKALEALGGRTGHKLYQWLDEHVKPRRAVPMICSEVVATAYWRADAAGTYALSIGDRDRPPMGTMSRGLPSQRDELHLDYIAAADVCELLLYPPDTHSSDRRARKTLFGSMARDHETGRPIGSVTPADLEHSPSLIRMGQIG